MVVLGRTDGAYRTLFKSSALKKRLEINISRLWQKFQNYEKEKS